MESLLLKRYVPPIYIPPRQYEEGFFFLEPSKILSRDIDDIYELEKDMWSRWLWEYVVCRNCDAIHGKHDIYTEIDAKTRTMTISELEEYFWVTDISCPCCGSRTDFIFGESYKDDIEKRYSDRKSIILVYRDVVWKIRWIFDGYISEYDDIYNKEFLWYYGEELRFEIQKKVEQKLWYKSDTLFCSSSLWTDQRHQNLQTVFTLMRMFYQRVSDIYEGVDGIYQSVLGTNMHAMYEVTWAESLWFGWVSISRWKAHKNFSSDMFIHRNIGRKSESLLWDTLKSFLYTNKSAIKKIVEKHL